MRGFIFSLLLLIVSAAPALCDDAQPSPPAETTADMQSMKDFLQANPDCREFNDSCSYCVVTNGQAECSTPQIACVKKAYQCAARSGK
ncbi:hypothetical protein [Rhizobium multihospitium]|uniref:Uncharacterized protein n=1 Tax=Rhizobium multihospitium TaxID=410764 RepID=A0A1C3V551_9HYPH|nr:hypothetical protein [Rhizobium multihospitium]SCB22821.1 hypothetical protein GA0061103_3239 [Rhizobium multihospitium]